MRTSLNYTSFTSQAVQLSILEAMFHCLATGQLVRLKNRKDIPWLAVTIQRDDLGYKFAFIDTAGFDQIDNVRRAAINEWPDANGNEFWRMMSLSFDLTQHPAKAYAEKTREVVVVDDSITWGSMPNGVTDDELDLILLGATHRVHSWGGTVLYGAYQRDWLLCKRLYILRGDQWIKATPEFLNCVRWAEEIGQ